MACRSSRSKYQRRLADSAVAPGCCVGGGHSSACSIPSQGHQKIAEPTDKCHAYCRYSFAVTCACRTLNPDYSFAGVYPHAYVCPVNRQRPATKALYGELHLESLFAG